MHMSIFAEILCMANPQNTCTHHKLIWGKNRDIKFSVLPDLGWTWWTGQIFLQWFLVAVRISKKFMCGARTSKYFSSGYISACIYIKDEISPFTLLEKPDTGNNAGTSFIKYNVRKNGFQWLHISKFTVETPKLEELDLKGSDFQNFHLTSQTLKQLEVSGLCTGSDVVQCNVDIK